MRSFQSSNSALRLLALGLVSLSIAACGGSMDDLNEYVDEVKSRPGQRPDPLPEVKPYETFVYKADTNGARSPFEPDTPTAQSSASGTRPPDDNRPAEYLEQYPLDSLAMVGTLEITGRTFGLLQDVDGIVHRVLPGNYVGQNDGRIQSVSSAGIEVMEIVSDGLGGYLEREATISLSD